MQKIIRLKPNMHRIFTDIERFYTLTSDIEDKKSLIKPCFDESFRQLADVFYEYGKCEYDIDFKHVDYAPIDIVNNDKNIILCFSGGKDSIATALHYKEQGYNVYLYYLKHINASLGDEHKIAKECADYLGLPIYFDDIKTSGFHMWMEHPMKNMIIANGAIQYGIEHNIGVNLAFGNYKSSILEENPFERCAGDCVDMWTTYENIIHRVLPDFKVHVYLENLSQTLSIVTKDRALLDRSVSCLCRHSLRPYRHQWIYDKFNVSLPKYRCGSCYKCCIEYIYMADRDLIEYSEDYYKYCLNQLYKVVVAEYAQLYVLMDVWNYCFMYPKEQSKLADKFDDCVLGGKNLKWK